MTRVKNLFAGLLLTASVALVPAANAAPAVHVAGAGSSAQFLTAAIGADNLGLSLSGVGVPTFSANATNCSTAGQANAVYHYSAKNAAFVVDTRSTNINPEKGNLWVVWVAACSDPTGATGVTDIWTDISVDSTVGVRALHAQTSAPGAQLGVSTPPPAAGNLISGTSSSAIWPDNAFDIALPSSVYNTIGTGITNATAGSDVHINVGLTDIRPEDALFATTRSLNAGNATLTGLGYRLIASNSNFGKSIQSGQPGSTAAATPESFALGGGIDPITGVTVPATTTIPVGAAPIVFALNHGTAASFPTNVVSGVTPGKHVAGQVYPLAKLFDGTTQCDTTNAAFTPTGTTVQNVNPVLREPLSGTMNTTEFNLFRSFGNTTDSQEKGVSGVGSGFPINPLNSSTGACSSGGGFRARAIGTGEVVNAIAGQTGAIGYFFYSFSNAKGLTASSVNYLTLDGVDPLGGIGLANNAFPACPVAPATNCPSSLWSHNQSFLTLRNGTYKAWSLYRWVIYAGGSDPVGPAALAQATQDAVDTTIADFVPFFTATGGISGSSDGLTVYRSHFKVTVPKNTCAPVGCVSVVGNNGAATTDNNTYVGNTLGGSTESGGDVGGLIIGPYNGAVTTSCTLTAGKGYKVTAVKPTVFFAGLAWEGKDLDLAGSENTVSTTAAPTVAILYVQNLPANCPGGGATSYAMEQNPAPGTLNKKQ